MPDRETHVSRAPVRLDVLGGTADFAGSVMLSSTLENAVIAGIQKRRDMRILIKAVGLNNLGANIIDYHFDHLINAGSDPDAMIAELRSQNLPDWSIMVLGLLHILSHHDKVSIQNGVTVGIHSSVAMPSGVNTGAALQTAVITALKSAFDLPFNAFQLAEFCLQTDRLAGNPGGIMAPLTSAMGIKNKLLAVRSQPHELLKMVPVPPGLQLFGIDCQIPPESLTAQLKHALVASKIGREIVFSLAEKPENYRGYLANIPITEWETQYRDKVPETISGEQFIKEYGDLNEPGVTIEPDTVYQVRLHTAFPIFENERVQQFIKHLEAFTELRNQDHLLQAGRIMYESGDHFQNDAPEDRVKFVMDILRNLGPEQGVYGARRTACCGSGTLVVLGDKNIDDHIGTLQARYQDAFHSKFILYRNSSPGALDQGTIISKI